MDYNFRNDERKWQEFWKENKTFKSSIDEEKPKYYVLDMFPYPSGAGLHVGHPLGYIASDIIARYKRLKGFNVLHPMGYDSFGLPAEQYAIQTGQHPRKTTEDNIKNYRRQLDQLGFSFDWDREVRTSDSNYYKWTQWIFLRLFNSYYDFEANKAVKIESLIQKFKESGNHYTKAPQETCPIFSSDEWNAWTEKEQQTILMQYRMAYLADSYVNWCADLGTVLANEEVKDGFSERGGYPVERKKMRQWVLRITAYADRLLAGLDTIDWSDAVKEMQRHWIGVSKGSSLRFMVEGHNPVEVFTTRPDTVFGCTFLVLAPEHELVSKITTTEQLAKIKAYKQFVTSRSERDRMSEVKNVTGEFTGAYAIHPFTKERIPVWIADYVLAGYGTGAVMAVPSGDERDFRFAKLFHLPIRQIMEGYTNDECYTGKEGILKHSDFLDGLSVKEATAKIIHEIEVQNLGKGKKEYRLRDAGFSRQRYWGEPIPIYYKDGFPYALPEDMLPLELPEVNQYLPTETGEPPLGRAKDWYTSEKIIPQKHNSKEDSIDIEPGLPFETNTMPGWAGSSWYYLRYQDPNNGNEFASKEALKYWNQIDLYIGGSEHATGHLLYVRFWTKFLNDLGFIDFDEPAKKLVNQGMILGRSNFVYNLLRTNVYFSEKYYNEWHQEWVEANDTLDENVKKNKHDTLIEKIATTIRNNGKPNYGGKPNVAKKVKKILERNQDKQIFQEQFFVRKKYVDVNCVDNDILDLEQFVENYNIAPKFQIPADLTDQQDPLETELAIRLAYWDDIEDPNSLPWGFIIQDDGKYHCGNEIEKMSKSKYNVVNPDNIIERFGADTLRMYEMFLGPLEMAKPWNTHGIEGVSRFLKKFWRLFHDEGMNFLVDKSTPSPEALKILHRTIKKIEDDLEKLSFNTSVSQFMITVNELSAIGCHSHAILEPLLILISPYAPHISEELWVLLGHPPGTISYATFPQYNPEFLIESVFNYPISINGKVKMNHSFSLDLDQETIQKEVLELPDFKKYLNGQIPKKVIVVKGRIINVVS